MSDDPYDSISDEARKVFDAAAKKIDRLDHPDHVVDDQRWIVRDLMYELIGMGVPASTATATILARCTINDPELISALLAFAPAP